MTEEAESSSEKLSSGEGGGCVRWLCNLVHAMKEETHGDLVADNQAHGGCSLQGRRPRVWTWIRVRELPWLRVRRRRGGGAWTMEGRASTIMWAAGLIMGGCRQRSTAVGSGCSAWWRGDAKS